MTIGKPHQAEDSWFRHQLMSMTTESGMEQSSKREEDTANFEAKQYNDAR